MRALAVVFGAVSVFFLFYTVRLLAVTHWLREIPPSGGGAYIGALAFPIIAVALAWAARGCWRRGTSPRA
jgi:hypothetical protein